MGGMDSNLRVAECTARAGSADFDGFDLRQWEEHAVTQWGAASKAVRRAAEFNGTVLAKKEAKLGRFGMFQNSDTRTDPAAWLFLHVSICIIVYHAEFIGVCSFG